LTDRFSTSRHSNIGGNLQPITPNTSSFHDTFKQAKSQITRGTPNAFEKENVGKSPRFAGEDTVKIHEMTLKENNNNLY